MRDERQMFSKTTVQALTQVYKWSVQHHNVCCTEWQSKQADAWMGRRVE